MRDKEFLADNRKALRRMISQALTIAEIADDEKIDCFDLLKCGKCTLSLDMRRGVKAIVELQQNFAELSYRFDIEAEDNKRKRQFLEKIFDYEDFDEIITDEQEEKLKEFAKELLKENEAMDEAD